MQTEFNCGKIAVSVSEMRHFPLETFTTILIRHGRDAALRLYQQWWDTVPKIGAENRQDWQAAWIMEERLGLKSAVTGKSLSSGN